MNAFITEITLVSFEYHQRAYEYTCRVVDTIHFHCKLGRTRLSKETKRIDEKLLTADSTTTNLMLKLKGKKGNINLRKAKIVKR